jgi:hypothetical protein
MGQRRNADGPFTPWVGAADQDSSGAGSTKKMSINR